MKAFVNYQTTAEFTIEVDIPDDTPQAERHEVARELADEQFPKRHPGSLCHHCSSKVSIGDFEQTEAPDGVWFA